MKAPNMRNVGPLIALAALLVNSPRYVQIFLRVDGLTLGNWEGGVLGTTGAATGLVLSGGQMYIAHLVAQPDTRRGTWYNVVIGVWLSMLLFSVVLIAPILVAGIAQEPSLSSVLVGNWRWVWAIVAVVSVEVLAAGAMVAASIAHVDSSDSGHPDAPEPTVRVEKAVKGRTAGRVVHPSRSLPGQRAGQRARPALPPAGKATGQASIGQSSNLPSWLDGAGQPSWTAKIPPNLDTGRAANLLRFYLSSPDASQRAAAEGAGLSKSSVGTYLSNMESAGLIDRSSGQVVVLVDMDEEVP